MILCFEVYNYMHNIEIDGTFAAAYLSMSYCTNANCDAPLGMDSLYQILFIFFVILIYVIYYI